EGAGGGTSEGRRASLPRLPGGEEPRENGGGLVPLTRGSLHLPPARARQRVKLRLAVVVGDPPRRRDVPVLFQLHQGGIHRAVVQLQRMVARLLDAARNSIPVLRTHG